MKKLFSVRTVIFAGGLLLQLNMLSFQSRGAAGDVDLSFDPGSGVNGGVSAVVVQPDGKVIIGGDFTTVKGLARSKVARLNADGSGDPSFNPGTAFDASRYVGAVALQPDGKVLIAVGTASYEGYAARLNSDGTVDTSFNPVTDDPVFCVALQLDGKVLIGGRFTTVNGTNRSGIARLNEDGSLDTSFDPGTGANEEVRSITLQSDGKVLVGGYFSAVNGTNRNGIARLNADGSLDSSFDPGTGTGAYYVTSVALQPDGKVLIGGDIITTVNGVNHNGIARLNADGSLDSSFNAGTGTDSTVYSIALQANGKILVARWFSDLNGTRGIARLNANGSLDITFTWGAGGYGGFGYAIALQPDGKMLIGGDFFTVNEVQRTSIARLNADGTLDGSFQPGKRIDFPFSALIALPNGKVLVNGFVHGTNQTGSLRLNTNGSLDGTFISTNFVPALGPDPTGLGGDPGITVEVGQSNGKVFVAGVYTGVECGGEGDPCDSFYSLFLARFNADGSRDTNFERAIGYIIVSPSAAELVRALAVQPDGKVVVGGYFSSFKGTNCNGIARLNANGSLDNSFNASVGNYYSVSSVALQSDGKVLIGGNFIAVNGTNRNNIARLNANGSLDSSFNPGTGANGGVSSVAVQSDGKVLIGGYFTTVNGTNRNHIARLNANGSLDSTFNPGTGADSTVYSVALQSDGKVLIGGDFTTVNGVVRPHVARLYGDFAAPSINIARSNAFVVVSWPVSGLNFQLQESTNFSQPNSWSSVAQPAVTNAGQISITVPTTVGRKFFRLKSQ